MTLLLDLIFPRYCFNCGKYGQYLCLHCQNQLTVNPLRYQSPSLVDNQLCLFPHQPLINRLLHDLNYNFVYDIAPCITRIASRLLKKNYPHLITYWQQNHYVLVPLPQSTSQINWRGFNQIELIAQPLAAALKIEYQTFPKAPTKDTISALNNSHILLFSDIPSTYSQLHSVSLKLKSTGAQSLSALFITS